MSRLKRQQSIDGLINALETISKSQCSLSENEVSLLSDAIAKLNDLRRKKGLTNKHYQLEIADVVNLINQFLVM
ncbi:hypothetical protein ACI76Y_09940 [Capnocytophaga cynodegmi]|uniref:hypothetical protein n=1 Tax=Capnocytophaga cynodegmi TaxID=28189 RepID=UPI00385C8D2A